HSPGHWRGIGLSRRRISCQINNNVHSETIGRGDPMPPQLPFIRRVPGFPDVHCSVRPLQTGTRQMTSRFKRYLFTLAVPVAALAAASLWLPDMIAGGNKNVTYETVEVTRGPIRKVVSTSGPV